MLHRLVALAVSWVLLPASFAVFATMGATPVSAADPVGEFSVFRGPAPISSPAGIATGPDGNLWVTNFGTGSVVTLAPDGSVLGQTAPSLSLPTSVTSGPDGAMWFTDRFKSTIGRITLDGDVVSYSDSSISAPYGITTGPDGNLWFTNQFGNSIGRITPDGVVTSYTDISIDGPCDITSGPDGAMWFTNRDGGSIGRITLDGIVTSYSAQWITRPWGITTGPDGNIWFTDSGSSSSIGRIAPGGAIVRFSGGLLIGGPTEITAGPDGNLWFTNNLAGSIGRITPDGMVSSFTDAWVDHPWGITTGPDGALWFTNNGGDSIGRVTTAGMLSEVVAAPISGPQQIASGSDGNLWFTNSGNRDSIGRITPDGAIVSYTDPSIKEPWGIALGLDGNIWFTDRGNNSIGRISPSGTVVSYTHPSIKGPKGITSGPDGALWFTNSGNDSIGRISLDGVVSNFTSASIKGPKGIASGPDGALWFANSGDDSIGRITVDGRVTRYTDTSIKGPNSITSGPDGALWFTNRGNNSIGRITPGGTVTSYSYASIHGPEGITAGTDGNLWFANSNDGSIARITPLGALSVFSNSSSAYPYGITTGPDGNIWFTDSGNMSIGRVGTGVSALPPSKPSKPTAVAGNKNATVSWVSPADGGSPVTGYAVRALEDTSKICTTSGATTCTVTGLTNGTSYTFEVKAINALGASPWSVPSDAVKPEAPPTTYFHPRSSRLIDSRPDWRIGPFNTPWTGGMTRDVFLSSVGGPANAKAVVLNVTVTDVTAPGGTFISVYPKGATRPNVSSLNASHGQTIANSVTTKVGEDGSITIYNDQGTANIIVDIAGYYTEGYGDGYTALPPTRVVDSRPAWNVGPYDTPWTAGQRRDVKVGLSAGVPSGADAVVLNVTATDATQGTFISVYPAGTPLPIASNLNLAPGNTIANQVVVELGTNNRIRVYNEAGSTNIVIDVVGYYMAGSGDAFHPISPQRIIDPRPAWQVGLFDTPWGDQTARQVEVAGIADVPVAAKAVVMNVTATDVTSPVGTFVAVFPEGVVRNASNLNAAAGWTIANAVTSKVGYGGKIRIYNEKPTANIIVDVNGYFG